MRIPKKPLRQALTEPAILATATLAMLALWSLSPHFVSGLWLGAVGGYALRALIERIADTADTRRD